MTHEQHSYQDVRATVSGDRVSCPMDCEKRPSDRGPSRWDKSPARCIRSGDYWLFVQLQPDVSKLDAIDSPASKRDTWPWIKRLQALRARGLDVAALRSAGPPSLPHNRLRELQTRATLREPLPPLQESKWSLSAGSSDPEMQGSEMSQRIRRTLLDLEEQLRRRPHLQPPSPQEDEHGLEVDFTEICKLDSQKYGEFHTDISCGAFRVLSNAVAKVCQTKKESPDRKTT